MACWKRDLYKEVIYVMKLYAIAITLLYFTYTVTLKITFMIVRFILAAVVTIRIFLPRQTSNLKNSALTCLETISNNITLWERYKNNLISY